MTKQDLANVPRLRSQFHSFVRITNEFRRLQISAGVYIAAQTRAARLHFCLAVKPAWTIRKYTLVARISLRLLRALAPVGERITSLHRQSWRLSSPLGSRQGSILVDRALIAVEKVAMALALASQHLATDSLSNSMCSLAPRSAITFDSYSTGASRGTRNIGSASLGSGRANLPSLFRSEVGLKSPRACRF